VAARRATYLSLDERREAGRQARTRVPHARSGDAVAIDAYLGGGKSFDRKNRLLSGA
jgi:hypothetical protein